MRNHRGFHKDSSLSGPTDLLMNGNDILNPFSVESWVPYVDTCQTDTMIIVRVELPGVNATDLSVSFQDDDLHIQGVKRKPGESCAHAHYHCLERRYGKFDRTIPIEWVVDPRRAQARLDKGILTIDLPRLKERRGHKIDIKVI